MKPFEIRFSKMNDKRRYRATVEVTSHNAHVLAVKVKAGSKEIDMEKYLFRKGNQWKMIRFNFKVEGSSRG